MRFDAFCGPTNTSVSVNITSEFCMNWVPERNTVTVHGQGTDLTDKNVRCSLLPRPGIKTFCTLPLSPVRGVFPGEYKLFAVGADHFYEIQPNGLYIDRSTPGFSGAATAIIPPGGPIGLDSRPVQCFFNGNQVLLVSAGNAYCDSGNGPVLCQFSDPLTDLVIDPTDLNGTTLTTAVGNAFDQSDVGRTVYLTGGSGFNLYQSIVISSVNSTGEAIGASSWGSPGSSLGTGLEYFGNVSYSDLILRPISAAPGHPSNVVGSASKAFGPSDVGLTLTITSSGGGWVAGTYTITGITVGSDGNPNGNAILNTTAGTAGSTGGIGSTGPMAVTAWQGAFLDGYFFACPDPLTKSVYFSAINDGRIWNPLDFFAKGNFPDNVFALFADHEELYTFGDLQSTQVWRDVGSADNPFAPDPGAVMHHGAQAPFSVVRLGNGVAWIGQDVNRGSRTAFHAVGYNPVAISTPAVEAEWSQYPNVYDAVAFSYSDQGHELWVINFQAGNATWVYDLQTGWWSQWGYWDAPNGWWDRVRTWVHCVCALGGATSREQHYGGDWQTGQIYVMSGSYRTDDGHNMVRRRWAPHLTVENQRRFYARFEIDCDRLGQSRIFWNRLGNGRDRIWMMDVIQATETGGATVTLSASDDRGQSSIQFFTQTLDPSINPTLANAYLKWTDATWN